MAIPARVRGRFTGNAVIRLPKATSGEKEKPDEPPYPLDICRVSTLGLKNELGIGIVPSGARNHCYPTINKARLPNAE